MLPIAPNSHQEYDGWGPDERDGSGELSLVASAVTSSLQLSILAESQLFHPPLGHLRDNRQGTFEFPNESKGDTNSGTLVKYMNTR